jgi:hypothetical protein
MALLKLACAVAAFGHVTAFALPQVSHSAATNSIDGRLLKPGRSSSLATRLGVEVSGGGSGGENGGPGAGVWQAYNSQLAKRPIITKSWTCFLIAALGDVLSQRLTPGFSTVDTTRMMKFGLAQFLYFGPVMHHWFGFINKIGTSKQLADKKKSTVVLVQTLVDQTLGSVGVISGFFVFFSVFTAALEGTIFAGGPVAGVCTALRNGLGKVQADLWPTLLANWKVWPLVNALNFAVIPLQYQVLFTNIVAVGWNVYLSAAMAK